MSPPKADDAFGGLTAVCSVTHVTGDPGWIPTFSGPGFESTKDVLQGGP